MQELLGTLVLLAVLGGAGYLVWALEHPRCRRCGKRILRQDDYVDICDDCFVEIVGEVKDVMK